MPVSECKKMRIKLIGEIGTMYSQAYQKRHNFMPSLNLINTCGHGRMGKIIIHKQEGKKLHY